MRPNRIPRALLLLALVCLLAASPALAAPDRGDAQREAERPPTLTGWATDVVLSIWERVRTRLDGEKPPKTKTPRTPGAGVDPDGWRPKGS